MTKVINLLDRLKLSYQTLDMRPELRAQYIVDQVIDYNLELRSDKA